MLTKAMMERKGWTIKEMKNEMDAVLMKESYMAIKENIVYLYIYLFFCVVLFFVFNL